jgi:hypothetical protein
MEKKLLPTLQSNVVNINQKLESRKSPKEKAVTAEVLKLINDMKRLQEEEEMDMLRNNKMVRLDDWKRVKGMQPASNTFPKL